MHAGDVLAEGGQGAEPAVAHVADVGPGGKKNIQRGDGDSLTYYSSSLLAGIDKDVGNLYFEKFSKKIFKQKRNWKKQSIEFLSKILCVRHPSHPPLLPYSSRIWDLIKL